MREIPSDRTATFFPDPHDPEKVAVRILSLVSHILEQEVLFLSLREEIRERKVHMGIDSQNSSKSRCPMGQKTSDKKPLDEEREKVRRTEGTPWALSSRIESTVAPNAGRNSWLFRKRSKAGRSSSSPSQSLR